MSELSLVQLGYEVTPGTLVAATHILDTEGGASVKFLDKPVLPRYQTGIAQPTIQNAYIGETGVEITVPDTACSFQLLAYLLNMAIKQVLGPATSFPFPLPTTAANTISTFTLEFVLARSLQEYEAGYCYISKLGFSANCDADGGIAKVNCVIRGRKAAPSTVTSSLALIPSREMMNLRTATFKIDALGTAAGTAAATNNVLGSFAIELDTGWEDGNFASSRADLDFALPVWNPEKMKLTGKARLYNSATLTTQIANARSATGIVAQVGFIGTSTLRGNFNLPILWDNVDVKTTEAQTELSFEAGYDSAGSTQGAAINLTLASTTIT